MRTFIGVGAQRTGTTWLFECLRSHPNICMPETKELHYFSQIGDTRNARQSLDWYFAQFPRSPECTIYGEITPEYLLDPESAKRIKSVLTAPKIIISLRNPITRALSAYRKGLRENNWDCSPAVFMKKNIDYCLDRGMYYQQILRYLETFDEKNVCIKIYEDIFGNPTGYLKSVFRFLEVNPGFISPMVDHRFNIGINKRTMGIRMIVDIRNQIYNILGDKGKTLIIKTLQRSMVGNRIMQRFLSQGDSRELDRELMETYKQVFKEDIVKTSKLINRNLISLWDLG